VFAFEFADEANVAKDTVIVAEVKVRSDAVEEAHEALLRGTGPARSRSRSSWTSCSRKARSTKRSASSTSPGNAESEPGTYVGVSHFA